MGAAATTAASNRARKEGKRYYWGAERPSVIERRVKLRMQQIDGEITKIIEDGTKEIERRVAAREEERLKLQGQKELLAQHREEVKRRRAFRRTSTFVVRKGDFTDEQVAAIKAQYPGIDDEEALLLLSQRAREGAGARVSEPLSSTPLNPTVLSESKSPAPVSIPGAAPVAAPNQGGTDKPKPAPIHIEAAVTIASTSNGVRAEASGIDGGDRDWSDFDPDAWEEGLDYPEHLYRAVQDRDRDYYLVRRMDMDEAVEPEPPEEFRELRQRERELEKALDALIEKHGKNSMVWSQEVADEFARLDRAVIQIGKEIDLVLAARSPSGVC